jgi:hypothetical protein
VQDGADEEEMRPAESGSNDAVHPKPRGVSMTMDDVKVSMFLVSA